MLLFQSNLYKNLSQRCQMLHFRYLWRNFLGEIWNLDGFITLRFQLLPDSSILGEITPILGKSRFSRFPPQEIFITSSPDDTLDTSCACGGSNSRHPLHVNTNTWGACWCHFDVIVIFKLNTSRRRLKFQRPMSPNATIVGPIFHNLSSDLGN